MPSENNEREPFLTAKEAAEHTGYSLQTIYNRVSRGDIPFHRREEGAHPRFLRSELDLWMRGQWVKPEPTEKVG